MTAAASRRAPRSRSGATAALATAVAGLLGVALWPASASALPPAPKGAAYGSHIDFWGWSNDSQWIAYTRTRRRPAPTRREEAIDEVQRMHRQVTGGALTGFGTMTGGDVADWARQHDYVVAPARVTPEGDGVWRFVVDGRPLVFAVEVGEGVAFRVRAGERVLLEHRFDKVYVGVTPALYPSPDRRQAVLVLALDTGWIIDAGLYAFALPPPPAPPAPPTAGGGEGEGAPRRVEAASSPAPPPPR